MQFLRHAHCLFIAWLTMHHLFQGVNVSTPAGTLGTSSRKGGDMTAQTTDRLLIPIADTCAQLGGVSRTTV